MRKILGTVVLTAMLLVPAQIVMAQEAVDYTPVMEMMMKTEMKMDQVMMKMMKARKKGMSMKMEKKLMKMLHDLDTLLNHIYDEI